MARAGWSYSYPLLLSYSTDYTDAFGAPSSSVAGTYRLRQSEGKEQHMTDKNNKQFKGEGVCEL